MSQKLNLFTLLSLITIGMGCGDSPYMQGKRLYVANCQNCHMEDGSGLAHLIPPLKSSGMLGQTGMVCIIKEGIQDTIKSDSAFLPNIMPSFSSLSTTEVTNIINYINHTWHTPFKEQSILDVKEALLKCN